MMSWLGVGMVAPLLSMATVDILTLSFTYKSNDGSETVGEVMCGGFPGQERDCALTTTTIAPCRVVAEREIHTIETSHYSTSDRQARIKVSRDDRRGRMKITYEDSTSAFAYDLNYIVVETPRSLQARDYKLAGGTLTTFKAIDDKRADFVLLPTPVAIDRKCPAHFR